MARSGPGTWKASPPADSIARRTRNSRRADSAEEEDNDLAKDADDGAVGCSDEEEVASDLKTSAADVEHGRLFQDSNQDLAQDSDSTRSRMKLDTREIAVVAPQTWHADWKSWQKYFEEHCEQTLQVIPILETMGRVERNRRIKKTKKGQDESVLLPEGLDPYQRTYICTHGWPQRKPRGSGKRPRQHVRLTDCPFRFVVQWQYHKGKWLLGVKRGNFLHNHHVSSETYATHPVARAISDAVVGATVEGMLAVGAKRSKIYDYLLEHDQNVTKADVDNMVQGFVMSVSTLDDDGATAAEVGALAVADPMNCTSISETESGETGVISLSTAFMRTMFSRFGEVLLVDCTQKPNRYNYQLLTFMVMNEFGEGVVVQHSLLESNGEWHMDRAIEHFKRAHPDGLKMLRVIIVDKDMNEVRVLQSHFPEARVLICLFHVIKYLKEKRSKPEYGKLSADDASQIDAAIHKMVYSYTQDEYDTTRESLRRLCARIGYSGFDEYFTRNWDSCQEMWVMHMRSACNTSRIIRTTAWRGFFGKLKNVINSSTSMAQCVQALIASDRRAENDYDYRLSRIGRFVNNNYDEEMANVLRLLQV